MRKLIIANILVSLLAGCDHMVLQPEVPTFSFEQQNELRSAVRLKYGVEWKIAFLCGRSAGVQITSQEFDKGYQQSTDGDGGTVFIFRSDGRSDIISRDAGGSYASAVESGGEVKRLADGLWSIEDPNEGAIETHNIVPAGSGKLMDFWTQSKSVSVISPFTMFLRSNCVRA